ncbi:acyltransferase family protein [Flavobacterium sp. RHBU_24]|uniref:acyltransferase family protein n=1 Tax=Flavobacterium sp. RHBU_24 TaxID=3391185 RepID=UPI003984701C
MLQAVNTPRRIDNIDLLKGVNIILVVMFHLTYFHSSMGSIRTYVTPYFMPLFFFTSGMFFSSKKSFSDFLLHKVNRLIIPLLFFYFANYFFGFFGSDIVGLGDKGLVDKFHWSNMADLFNGREHFNYAGAIWFLVCMFNLYIIYYFVSKIKNVTVKFILCALLSFAGYLLNYYSLNLPYFLDSALSMVIFFFLGDFVRKNPYVVHKNKLDYPLLAILSILYVLMVNGFDLQIQVMLNEYQGNYGLIVLRAILGISVIYIICKRIGKVNIINFFGENSLIILCTHQVLINVFSVVLKKLLHIDGVLGFTLNLIITMACEYVIIILLNKYLPYFVAKKDLIKAKQTQ